MQIILNHTQTQQKIKRLGHEIIENCFEEKELFIGGISGNGFELAKMITSIIENNAQLKINCFEILKILIKPLSTVTLKLKD